MPIVFSEMSLLRKILAEPLVHFLVLGLALFVGFRFLSPDAGFEQKIIVTEGTVAMLSQRHSSVWRRAPTQSELKTLVDNYVKDEILFREGVKMGLDRNDPVIQRRVLQKLEVISEELSSSSPPSDTELADYLNKNAERYVKPPIVTFRQVLFDPTRHGAELAAEFSAMLSELNAGGDPARLGDQSLLPAKEEAASLDQVARQFGEEFAQAVGALPVGSWQGPVRSGFGVHLVCVDAKIDGEPANLGDVRAEVERDWEYERRQRASETFYQSLRQDYDVVLEVPLSGASQMTKEQPTSESGGATGR